ncbi:MAG: hypothetical protein IH934_01520 [Nanoarchaeota archaeon]|nr:hypothetical protein [Nanoarchaeota archaeon]
MIQFGIFRFEKKDTFVLIGAIVGLIGIFQYHLVLGTITLICAIISKFLKAEKWSWVLVVAVSIYVIWAINTFWIG